MVNHQPLTVAELQAAVAPHDHASRTFDLTNPPGPNSVFTDWKAKYDNDYVGSSTPFKDMPTPDNILVDDPFTVLEQDTSVFVKKNVAPDVTILAGRFVGKFDYDLASIWNAGGISSYGHKRIGDQFVSLTAPTASVWASQNPPGNIPDYIYASPAINSVTSQNASPDGSTNFYTSVPDYFTSGENLVGRQIFVAAHDPNSSNHTAAVVAARDLAKANGGFSPSPPMRFITSAP